jgi:23S rRNA (pseudouridine1915-N3)-methyltransferase
VKLSLLCVGDVKGPLGSAVDDYEARVARYWRFQVEEVTAGSGKGKKVDPQRIRRAEGERLVSRIPSGGGEVISLTRGGKRLGSRKLARRLAEFGLRSVPQVTFVIGGAYGLDQEVLERSTMKLSLSSMTLPHEVARLVLAEQLYRAGTILKNEPYHKGG